MDTEKSSGINTPLAELNNSSPKIPRTRGTKISIIKTFNIFIY